MINCMLYLVVIPWVSVDHVSPVIMHPKEEHHQLLPYYTTGFL